MEVDLFSPESIKKTIEYGRRKAEEEGGRCRHVQEGETPHSISCRTETGDWDVLCEECAEKRARPYYTIPLERFFVSNFETVDWIAHLSEKSWFVPKKFIGVFRNLRGLKGAGL